MNIVFIFVCVYIGFLVFASVCHSLILSVCIFVGVPFSITVCVSVCLSACLPICLPEKDTLNMPICHRFERVILCHTCFCFSKLIPRGLKADIMSATHCLLRW